MTKNTSKTIHIDPTENTHPITINEEFICENCGFKNTKAQGTCRNHCANCLCSKHVDDKTPGDRKSTCHGIMRPTIISYNNKKGFQILHRCTHCTKEIFNKSLDDDNQELLIKIMQQQNIIPPNMR